MARTYTQLKKEKTSQELTTFAAAVTKRYATSEFEYSQSDVARDNNITVACLRRLMDEAIISAEVSLQIAEFVKNKAAERSKLRVADAGTRSRTHHYDLMRKREDYLLTALSKVEVNKITEDIAYNPSKSIQYFTKKYNQESDRMIGLILRKSIVENISSDEVMELIIKRSLGDHPTEKAKQTFQKFREEREEYKKKSSQ